jgi:hypothetical protein
VKGLLRLDCCEGEFAVDDRNILGEDLSRLWDVYVEAAKRYEAAKRATDVAEAARDVACQACESAYRAWERACAEEVDYGRAVRQAALAFEASRDAVFLSESGIEPGSVLPS